MDVLLWTPSRNRRMTSKILSITDLCEHRLQPGKPAGTNGWWRRMVRELERVRKISASSVTWWYWWWYPSLLSSDRTKRCVLMALCVTCWTEKSYKRIRSQVVLLRTLSDKCPWESHELPNIHCHRLNSTITVLSRKMALVLNNPRRLICD